MLRTVRGSGVLSLTMLLWTITKGSDCGERINRKEEILAKGGLVTEEQGRFVSLPTIY